MAEDWVVLRTVEEDCSIMSSTSGAGLADTRLT
jgi:hypothetical protein